MSLKSTLARGDSKNFSGSRIAGPMPWVIAIMVFLTILAAAAGIAIADAALQNNEILARKMTVQILEENPAARSDQRTRVSEYLDDLPQTDSVQPLSDADVIQLLEPWLGLNENTAFETNDFIPLPAIIDVQMKNIINDQLRNQMLSDMQSIAPSVRIDTQESWIAPLYDLMRSFIYLILGLVLLLAAATSATVVLAVRSALDTHRNTLDIMHLMGSTDNQISRLFQRRVAVDAFFGGTIGFITASLTIWFISSRLNNIVEGVASQIAMPDYGWIMLAFIPILMGLLSIFIARWTVRRAMQKIL